MKWFKHGANASREVPEGQVLCIDLREAPEHLRSARKRPEVECSQKWSIMV